MILSLNFENLFHKLWVHSHRLQFASLELLMTVPVGSLREHFEAAPTWKWLLARV